MYTVISYNNSRNNGTVKFLEVFSSCVKAIRCARKYANFEYGEQNVTDHISQHFVDIKDVIIEFTSSRRVKMDVFAVVTLPAQKDDDIEDVNSQADTDSESDTDIENEIENENDTDIENGNESENESDTGIEIEIENETSNNDNFDDIYDYNDYDDEYDGRYDEIYDDRYDEREDYGYDGGYEDECFECLDL